MEEYIFALIAFVVLLPVLFFLPGGITKKGKIWIAGGGLLISLMGLLALNQYSLLMVAIILFLLVIVSSLVIGNRFGPQLLAEEGVQDTTNHADAGTEKEERILFSTVEEELPSVMNASDETFDSSGEEIQLETEKEAEVEFIPDEELGELPLVTDLENPDHELKDQKDLQEDENALDNEETKEEILEEMPYEGTADEELSEIEWLIQQEEQDNTELVHNLESDEQVSEEDTLEELSIIDAPEKSQSDLPDEELETLSEIELMIHHADEETTSPLADLEEELIHEDTFEHEEMDELQPIEITNKELEFLKDGSLEETHEGQVQEYLVPIEEVTGDDELDEAEDSLPEERLSESPEVEELEEEFISENNSIKAKQETDDQEELVSDDLTEKKEQDKTFSEEDLSAEETETRSPLQARVIQTIVEELAYYKDRLPLGEFESLAGQYMHPNLHDRDYYVLSQQLIQRYYESKEYKKLKTLIDGIEERFISYPILKSELNDYKEIAWKNIVKQQMMENGRE
jgi:hypothetical protein